MSVGGISARNDWQIDNSGLGSSSVITGKDASQMTMDDFFSLMVAQMKNQDMLNPEANTDYVAQMATFTTLQGINSIQEYQLASYASSYAGKTVAIAHTGENGTITKTEGLVTGVTFYDGEPKVIVNGVSYPLYAVMEVKSGSSAGSTEAPEEGEVDDGITMESASAYVDRYVTIRYQSGEEEVEVEGLVTGLTLHENGRVQVIVDGSKYYASDIVAVHGQEDEPAEE